MSNLYHQFYNDVPTARMKKALDENKAQEIAAYVERNEKGYIQNGKGGITLSNVCQRFRLLQEDALRIINDNPNILILSNFALKPASKEEIEAGNWGAMLSAKFLPKIWPTAPKGKRIVITVKNSQGG